MTEVGNTRTQLLIADLWQRNLPRVLKRLAVLDEAANAASRPPLLSSVQQEAFRVAHNFAGSLGMFGFPEGTRLAREIESELNAAAPQSVILTALTVRLRQALFAPAYYAPPLVAAEPSPTQLQVSALQTPIGFESE